MTAKTLSVACGDSSPRGRSKGGGGSCLSLWERWLSEAKTERVHRDGQGPLSRLRRQLSQRESHGAVRIRTILHISLVTSIDCTCSKATINKSDVNLTGGAYYSAREVTQCECKSFRVGFLSESYCGTSPASPALFSPLSFLLREKRQGRRRQGQPIPGAEFCCYVNFNLVHSADCIFSEI